MPDVLVEARDLVRTYLAGHTPVHALRSATCNVVAGQRIALVGASGSGKSTLLHLMSGIDEPSSGSLRWPALGERHELRPSRVALVFQVTSLLPSLTAVENASLPMLLGGDTETAEERALAALDRLGLAAIANKLPEELSGGQAQRVAIARALAYHPRLVLADEPTGQLDHPTAQHLLDTWLEALEGTDMALVIATHDPAVATRMNTTWKIDQGVLATPSTQPVVA